MDRGLALFFAIWVGVSAAGMSFAARGQPDSTGWYWAREAHAEWQFFDLPTKDEALLFGLTLETRGWTTPPPFSLGAVLTFSCFGCGMGVKTVRLQKVYEQGSFVRYFGQVFLARRDLAFGSCLRVGLKVPSVSAEVGVHRASLSLVSHPVSATVQSHDMGGPFVPAVSGEDIPRGELGSLSSRQTEYLSIRECEDANGAPYLAPGTYQEELGRDEHGYQDNSDWFRINLQRGQCVELRVNTPYPVTLRLLTPLGHEVAHVEGHGRLGLFYEARDYGAFIVCVSIFKSTPFFYYTVEIRVYR